MIPMSSALVKIFYSLNLKLSKLTNWLRANRLTLNVKKTHYIIFSGPKKDRSTQSDIIINNQIIDRVTHTRFLGVMIDESLQYKEHIAHVKGKCARGVGILCRAKKFFSVKTLVDLYHAFIHPYMYYCVEIWGNTNPTYLKPIVKVQKRAVKIIMGASRRSSSEDILKLLRIVPFSKLHTLGVYVFLYKLINNAVPKSISATFQFNNNIHNHGTRQSQNIHIDSVTCTPRRRCIRYQASVLFTCDDIVINMYNLPYVVFKYNIKSRLLDL